MRWISALLLAAACGTTYSSSDEGNERIAGALRGPGAGDTILVAGSRAYYLRSGALAAEVDAFSGALADEVARSGNTGNPMDSPGLSRGDVVAFAYPTGQLDLMTEAGFLRVQRTRGGRKTDYRLTLRLSASRYLQAAVAGTTALDNAWLRLEAMAARRARESWGASPYRLHVQPAEPVVGLRHDIGVEWNEEK